MTNQIHTQNQHTEKETQDSSNTTVQEMFKARPFVVQSKKDEEEQQSKQADLETSLMQAERYGHNLSKINSASVPDAQIVQPKLRMGNLPGSMSTEANHPKIQSENTVNTGEVIQTARTRSPRTSTQRTSTPLRRVQNGRISKPPQKKRPNQSNTQSSGKKRPASSSAAGNSSKKSKSDRPDFPKDYKNTYLDEFNNRPNGKTTLSPNQRLDQTTPKYSRNHRVSYEDQQRLFEQRRQGKITQQQFTQSTNALYPKDTAGKPTGFGANRMQQYRQQMLAAKTPAERAKYEKKMATHLNAAPMNVTIGGSGVNSTIGKHFDPNVSTSPGGTYSLTPRTKQTFDFGVNNISKPMLSPGETRIASSHMNDRKGGFFPQPALSPTSSGLMNNLMLNGRGNAGHVSPTNKHF
ncbi:hypothetical protein [Nostoc sp.]|uniref:hypothetical protein n=1 Tax=Nostoc sp. TaxID=1180 RepID=UPI002FF7DF03